IAIGTAASSSGRLHLNNAALDTIQDGFASITIGHANGSGVVDVNTGSYVFKDDVILRTPVGNGDITLNGALATGSGTEVGTITLQAGRSILGISGASVTTQGEDILFNADRDQGTGTDTGAGNIQLVGTTVTSNGGAI